MAEIQNHTLISSRKSWEEDLGLLTGDLCEKAVTVFSSLGVPIINSALIVFTIPMLNCIN